MSYERKDIPALISVFQEAKQHISGTEGCNYFLCNALRRTESAAAKKAIEIVRESIGGYFTLRDWLNRYGDYRYLGDNGSRRLRVRWCDKIIADLKEYAK